VIQLFSKLCKERSIIRENVLYEKNRNAADDLVNLNLARWKNYYIVLEKNIENCISENPEFSSNVIQKAAMKTPFLFTAKEIWLTNLQMKSDVLGRKIAKALRKSWSQASCKRCGGSAKRWLTYFGIIQKNVI
jgi:hypothetical protein